MISISSSCMGKLMEVPKMKLLISLCCFFLLVFDIGDGMPADNSTLSSSSEEGEGDAPTASISSSSHATTTIISGNREAAPQQPDSIAYKIDGVDDVDAVSVGDSNVTVVNRTAHARMSSLEELFQRRRTATTTVTSTTLLPVTEYDYWWYFTTPRRPRFSHRDFPGKPGVAIWKEISPATAKETKKNRKASEPTAEGVLAGGSTTSAISPAIILTSMMLLRHNYYFVETF